MNNIKIISSSLNQVPMDWDGNIKRIIKAIKRAKKEKAAFLLLPELCLTAYGCEDWFLSKEFSDSALHYLIDKIVPEVKDIVVMVGLPVWHLDVCYNAVAVISNEEIVGIVFKKNLCHDGIHYEDRWFKEWPLGKFDIIKLYNKKNNLKQEVIVGDVVFKANDNIVFGFEICEDAWAAQRPGSKLVQHQVDIIFNPSASHFAFGKADIRRNFIIEGSRAFNCAYVYSNLLGNESGRVIYDGDTYIAVNGSMRSAGKRFSFKEYSFCEYNLNLDEIAQSRNKINSYRPHKKEEDSPIVRTFNFNLANHGVSLVKKDIYDFWEKENKKEKEFTYAVSLGLWDYMRKTGSEGYVVSLSGGCDSTVCAVLIKKAFEYAYRDGVLLRDSNTGLMKIETENEYLYQEDKFYWNGDISDLLTCVYQGSENSSSETLNAAKTVSEHLKAKFRSVPIGDLIEKYKDTFSDFFEWNLNWEEDDILLQNIQARVRAPGVWMVANKEGKILITTSNRSESAVGYATMDGDTCGGLAPIAGVDKDFLRHWLKWMERNEMPFLRCVNNQSPTAELRPSDKLQTDEKDLMPYNILDKIEGMIVREKLSVKSVFENLKVLFPQEREETLFIYLKRFCNLWTKNQWKRERYAPAFHLDDHNLDPKTGCRFPILSKAFRKEIEKLEQSFIKKSQKGST